MALKIAHMYRALISQLLCGLVSLFFSRRGMSFEGDSLPLPTAWHRCRGGSIFICHHIFFFLMMFGIFCAITIDNGQHRRADEWSQELCAMICGFFSKYTALHHSICIINFLFFVCVSQWTFEQAFNRKYYTPHMSYFLCIHSSLSIQ